MDIWNCNNTIIRDVLINGSSVDQLDEMSRFYPETLCVGVLDIWNNAKRKFVHGIGVLVVCAEVILGIWKDSYFSAITNSPLKLMKNDWNGMEFKNKGEVSEALPSTEYKIVIGQMPVVNFVAKIQLSL